eukprot:scaffold20874_cov115-Skeletonema_dohrnii-CCMP3373.AAC.4
MGQRSNDAVVKDAQMYPSKEECVFGMGPSSNDANARLKKKECVSGTGRRANYAAAKDAQTKFSWT